MTEHLFCVAFRCATAELSTSSPIRFVLVRTSPPGNIGAAARAIRTMGFRRLGLVAPHRFPHPEAVALAAGADEELDKAAVTPTLVEAVADCTLVLGCTARKRVVQLEELSPRQAAARALAASAHGEVALVFGNERTGLANEHVEQCSALAHIPANPAYSSLNLAQAIQVLAYELRVAFLEQGSGLHHAQAEVGTLAQSDEIERMYAHLENALVALDFLDPRNPKKLMPRLRRLFARTGLEREEVNILRGILARIDDVAGPAAPP